MAYKRSSRFTSYTRKRRYARKLYARPTRRLYQRRRGTVVGTKPGLPLTMKIQHKYVQKVFLTSTPSTNGGWQFRANSLYDPDASSVGHQPMLFDQMSALYNHWVVIGSRAKFTFTPVTPAPTRIVAFYNDDTLTTYTDMDTLCEQMGAKARSVIITGTNPMVTTLNWSAKKTFGGSVLSDSDLQGTASANPQEETFFQLNSQTMDGVNDTNVYVLVEITYIAVWSELKDIPGS